jgi:hypothetical protein
VVGGQVVAVGKSVGRAGWRGRVVGEEVVSVGQEVGRWWRRGRGGGGQEGADRKARSETASETRK